MCGIGGIRRFGPEPIERSAIEILLCALQRRGTHATGIALQNPGGEIQVLKKDVPAWDFVSGKPFEAFIEEHLNDETVIVTLHTRAATKGSPKDNDNNHPLFTGNTAVVHNGMIRNDDELFRDLKLKRSGQVDSDILRAILDKHGLTRDGIKALQKVQGSVAIAAMCKDQPGKLILGRSGSPLVLASTEHHLVWASEKSAIHAAYRPYLERFGVQFQANRSDLAFMTMNNDSLWLLGEEREVKEKDGIHVTSLEWHDEFKSTTYYTAPNYRMEDGFADHRNRFNYDDKKTDVIICPNRACGKYITLTPKLVGVPLKDLICTACKSALEAA